MGLIQTAMGTGVAQAAGGTLSGVLADQWLEVFEAKDMGEGVVFTKASRLRPDDERNKNRKGTTDVITHGSRIQVYDAQAMFVVDGGRITDFSAVPGTYTLDNTGQPTIFSGDIRGTLLDSWERFKFGGGTPQKQQVFFVNLQEIKGIKFGTPSALNYFDSFYNAELFLRCHGTFSIKIADPILFYQQVVPRDSVHLHIDEVKEQYMSEFLEALQTSINQMSVAGIRISQVPAMMRELSQYMRYTLDEDWLKARGMEIQSVGIASITYDEESRKLIDMRNQGAMLSDPSVREGYVQGAVARGMEAAGSNEAGAGVSFMGMGMGMSAGGNFMGAAAQSNQAQMAQQQGWQAQNPQQGQWAQQPGQPQTWSQPASQGQVPPQGQWVPQPPQGQQPAQQWTQQPAQPQQPGQPQSWGRPQPWGQQSQAPMPPQGQVPPQGQWVPQPPQGQQPSQPWTQQPQTPMPPQDAPGQWAPASQVSAPTEAPSAPVETAIPPQAPSPEPPAPEGGVAEPPQAPEK